MKPEPSNRFLNMFPKRFYLIWGLIVPLGVGLFYGLKFRAEEASLFTIARDRPVEQSQENTRSKVRRVTDPSTSAISKVEMADALTLAIEGDFPNALEMARKVDPTRRLQTITSIFSLWTERESIEASKAALSLADDTQRNVAWTAVIACWSNNDPERLANYALGVTEPIYQQQALEVAVSKWLETEETIAMKWVSALPSSVSGDLVIAAVAKFPALIERDPVWSVTWAEAIQDTTLRSRTLGEIVRVWLVMSPESAASYARNSAYIFPEERENILLGERFIDDPHH